MSVKNVPNRDAREYVLNHVVFSGNNIFSVRYNNLYVVYSYGTHFPMYVYDFEIENWIYNTGKYSATTSKHQSQTNPLAANPIHMNTDKIQHLINLGGYVDLCAERVNPEYEEIA